MQGIVGVFAETPAVRVAGGGRARRGHEVFVVQRGKEFLTGNGSAVDYEIGHVLPGIGGVEIAQNKIASVIEMENEVIPGPFERGISGGEIKQQTGIGLSIDDILRPSCGLGQSHVGHDGVLW